MKKHIEIPKFWFGKFDAIDANIMEEFPYAAELSRKNLKHHYKITTEIIELGQTDKITWRAAKFYFKDENDRLMFMLKWS